MERHRRCVMPLSCKGVPGRVVAQQRGSEVCPPTALWRLGDGKWHKRACQCEYQICSAECNQSAALLFMLARLSCTVESYWCRLCLRLWADSLAGAPPE